MTFEKISYIAQTWGLLYLFILFIGMLIYALRPSAREKFEKASRIPLRED